jgi:peptide/nickel transport system substrate-binding protein
MALAIGRRSLLAATGMALLAPAEAREPSVLRFIPESGLVAPDPIAQPTSAGRAHGMMVWDLLFGVLADGTPVPQMAAGSEASADGLHWRITLRDGLRFHDGTAVRAADCVASIRRWGARRPFGQKLLARTEALSVVDALRFDWTLSEPFPLLLTALGGDTCFIMPQALAETDPATPVARIIGSGPYRFVPEAYVAGSRAAYARFELYQAASGVGGIDKAARVDRVEWMTAEPAAAIAALARGAADWWENPPPDQIEAVRQVPDVQIVINQQAGVMPVLCFNHLQPPFNNRRLLRALLPALDQGEFMTASMAGAPALSRTDVGVFAPQSPAASDAGMAALTAPRDLDAARHAVQESGYGGETVQLMSPTDLPRVRALTEVASDLFQRVGLIVEVADMDWATLVQRRATRAAPDQGGWSAFCTTFTGLALGSPATHPLLRGSAEASGFGWPTSPRLERLRDAWFDATSARARARICAEMQTIALHEVPFLPLGRWLGVSALRSGLSGVGVTPYPVFWGVAKA